MPEPEPTTAEPTERALSALERLADRSEKQRDPETGKARSWWRRLLIGVLLLGGLAIGMWMLGRNRRELAKLRHEKFKRQTAASQAEVDAHKAASMVERDQHLNAVKKAEDAVKVIDESIREARRRYELDKEAISRLRWGDLPRADDNGAR